MDRVRIRVEDFEDGVLPNVCIATGRPADGCSKAVAITGLGWGVLLPVLGVLTLNVVGFVAGLVILSLMTRRAQGLLPWTHAACEVSRQARRHRWILAAATAVVTAGAAALALIAGSRQLTLVSVIVGGLVVGGLALSANSPPGSVKLRLESNGRWVEVRNASPHFVSAYRDQLRLRRRIRTEELERARNVAGGGYGPGQDPGGGL